MKKTVNRSIRIFIASVYILGGLVFFKQNYKDHQFIEELKQEGVATTAVVKDVKITKDGICPFIEFKVSEGEKVAFLAFENEEVEVGETVEVKYNPENIQQAAILADLENYPRNFKESVFGSAVFCAICLFVSVFTLTSKRFKLQIA
ncbi:hypothetical protein R9C00_02560 [Flammeovirgaceae bacterium SG7u.111]|nr:hypothetical protein [Flammeovirgaceae bacterium SG7u.132]WPO36322.1 hypothetical protein R9C00_02560 [Flammeovirgaceae bacterium SG7u.111]